MDDRDVISAFVRDGARRAFGPTLNVEGDGLFLDGWWQTAFRVAPYVFILRNEEPPGVSTVVDDVAAELRTVGLQRIGDHPAIVALVYTQLTLGSTAWELWAQDVPAGETALMARAGGESFLGSEVAGMVAGIEDHNLELGAARRLAGLPPSLILVVGVDPGRTAPLQAALPDCRIDARGHDDVAPADCGALLPTVVLVDATDARGRAFLARLRDDDFGRVVPVAAVAPPDDAAPGADVVLDPAATPAAWADPLRRLLP